MTATAPAPTMLAPAIPASETPVRLSREQYYRLVATGVWGEQDPELVDGILVERMSAASPLHSFVLEELFKLLGAVLSASGQDANWYVRSEKAIDEPNRTTMPDIALVRGSNYDYITANPTPDQVAMIAEVALTTKAKDLARAAGYGCSGVPSFIVVDVVGRSVIQFSKPTADGYASEQTVDAIEVELDGVRIGSIRSADLFPPV